MFDKAKNNDNVLGKTNRIVEGTVIRGDIESKADFRLDGVLVGNYTSTGKLVVGPSGEVQGDVKCKNVDIEGKFTGKLIATELLTVKSKASINGEVTVGKLAVEPGAVFEATCTMKNQLKSVANETKEKSA
ncbi:polymer-forming cytoskeletal protein [Flavobacterium sp. NRK F10]|uniref:Polymer-forming cytoskeletal protein n=1 Tax=Flavobacterium sediminis TaxID=2201181 RepID=A0A2U8QUK6_9FLAO|nr:MULTISPECIES: polymer-forming cytoskeletal protein [Flavobacterium]AWM13769.1 polymer-forming cytoskeletal protein [Flavobacterium sediminis]MCO6174930.1 polymer-forming cytoskeletal protein [Flavobacterium sp. NRK F10]